MIGFAGIFTWLGRTLTRKFILLLVGFLLLPGAPLFIGVFGNLHVGGEAALINDAGRQRMRTFQLASLTHQAVIAGSWSPAQRPARVLRISPWPATRRWRPSRSLAWIGRWRFWKTIPVGSAVGWP